MNTTEAVILTKHSKCSRYCCIIT